MKADGYVLDTNICAFYLRGKFKRISPPKHTRIFIRRDCRGATPAESVCDRRTRVLVLVLMLPIVSVHAFFHF